MQNSKSPAQPQRPPVSLVDPQEGQQEQANNETNIDFSHFIELLEFQSRQTEQLLSVQGRTFEAAVTASTQSLHSLEIVLLIAAFFISASSVAAGWVFKRGIDRIESKAKESEEIIRKQSQEVGSLSSELSGFRDQIGMVKSELVEAQDIKSRFENLQKSFERQEEQIEVLATKTRIALLGLDLHSESREERLRAAEAISEIIRTRSGRAEAASFGMALKLFLDCLRRLDRFSDVVREVLYGFQHCAESITRDENVEAVTLILNASRSAEALVRVQALETLGKIGLWYQEVEARFWECLDNDNDIEVRATVKRILREAGRLPIEQQ